MPVSLGSDVLIAKRLLQGRTIGLVANPASVDSELRHVADRVAAGGMRIGALFGPQHGFRSDLQENMIESPHGADARRRVPVYSLYSETREPTARMLKADALVSTCKTSGRAFIPTSTRWLDAYGRTTPRTAGHRLRPAHLIGGVAVEGLMLEPGFTSFVGQYPIPMRHGMTIGEWHALQRAARDWREAGSRRMTGWSRERTATRRGCQLALSKPPTIESGRLSGHGAVRGHERVRGPRHDATV
jgi:uncharacterized protein YbbC (DUF1343 family)